MNYELTNPRFSILLPAYKAAFLDQCISSVVTQDCDDWQLVIVDDCSPADLRTIVAPYLADPRVTYHRMAVGHGAERVVDNWNECLGRATGEFVMCIGDDDMLLPHCLASYNALMDAHPGLDVYHTRLVVINERGETIALQEERPETEDASAVLWHKWQGRRQAMGDWLLRADVLRAHGGFAAFPYGWATDDVTAAWTATRTGVANGNTPGYAFRMHDGAITRSYGIEQTLGKLRAWDMVDAWLDEWLPTLPADAPFADSIRRQRTRYIAGRKRGDLYHGLSRSPASLCRFLRRVDNLPSLTVLALWLKKLCDAGE